MQRMTREDVLALVKDKGASNVNLAETDLSYINLSNIRNLVGIHFGRSEWIEDRGQRLVMGANLAHSYIIRSKLQCAYFRKANLAGAQLYLSDFEEASFELADLSNARLKGADLRHADLFGANLSGAMLLDAKLSMANLYDANLNGARLGRREVGECLLQEYLDEYEQYFKRWYIHPKVRQLIQPVRIQRRYIDAMKIYGALRVAFASQGFSDDARWAYKQERRMGRLWAHQQLEESLKEGSFPRILSNFLKWFGDWIVELLCDYGESVWRVVFWIAFVLFIAGPISISICGGLTALNQPDKPLLFWGDGSSYGPSAYMYVQYLLYMLDTFTTADFCPLQPANDLVRLFSGLLAFFGIFLAGLLGFVAANRIRNY